MLLKYITIIPNTQESIKINETFIAKDQKFEKPTIACLVTQITDTLFIILYGMRLKLGSNHQFIIRDKAYNPKAILT